MQHRVALQRSMGRRAFMGWASSRGAAVGAVGLGLPTVLAACGNDSDEDAAIPDTTTTTLTGVAAVSEAEAAERARAVVGDVTDFALSSDDWPGGFGYVTLVIRPGVFDGQDVWYVRTDSSDVVHADRERLVHVPKLAPLTGEGLSGAMYVVEDDPDGQPAVLSTQPGRDDYTPAWTLHRVRWQTEPRVLRSEQEIRDAEAAGALAVERSDVVVNAGVVKWSDGEMAVDTVRRELLGGGQLLEPVDTVGRRAVFKLGQCYPGSRYFVLDHSVAPAAEMTHTLYSPRLADGPREVAATGRTNVFVNGVAGPGPMGFQPSAFDFDAGDPSWSPYWDHWSYAWRDGNQRRVLYSEEEIHAARDAGELEEYPGTPDMSEVFTVNCPVPVLAPPTYQPPTA